MSGITEIIEAEDPIENEEQSEVETPDEQTEQVEESTEQKEEAQEDEIVVSFGDEPAQEEEKAAPQWVKELRKANREKDRQIRELQAKIQGSAPAAPKLGKKPSLDDFDYDTDKFEEALTSWYDQKKQVEEIERKAEEKRKADEQAWANRLETYTKAKASLKVSDYEDAEMAVQEALNVTQQGLLVKVTEMPAHFVYGLGKNSSELKRLKEIQDPIEFVAAVVKLESKMKAMPRKSAPPPPERRVSGAAPVSGSIDSTLERLRAEAEKTGNYTKVVQYKRAKQS
jgi:hypothetical protein